ncbi:YdeI/OmpD-associated family protein [Bizionia arctica]|nr:YdeI/OmpD-associated family protein [Bizionia arctica]
MPEELKKLFEVNPEFKKAFKNLTEGRQRGYLLHFTKPKQAKTRFSRIETNMERILDGYGLNDCTCGLSKRKPNCDGSHKQLE